LAKIKNFFKNVGLWFKNHAPSKRRIIQLYAALLHNANVKGLITGTIYTGKLKNLCSPGLNCYSCPAASAACPLGALQDSLASSGTRTPYYILGIFGILGLMLARTICGFLCPTGFVQELLYKIKTPKLKKSRVTRVFSYFKYVLLIFLVIAFPLIYAGPGFCEYICPSGTFGGAIGLLSNPNNSALFSMLGFLFSWKFILLVIFVVASIFIYRFFCRFICPLGAIYGFFNKIALLGVKLEKDKCVDCGMCLNTCKMDIKHVGDHECINCGECIPVCPTKAISWKGSKIFVKGIVEENAAQNDGGALSAVLASGSANAHLNGGVSAYNPEEIEQTAPISVYPEQVEDKPLPELLQNGRAKAEQTLNENVENPVSHNAQPAEDISIAEAKAEEGALNSAKAKKQPLTNNQKIRKRNFWLKVAAWAAATVLLISAFVYYNAIYDSSSSATAYVVGDRCPDFVIDTYESKGAYDENGNQIKQFSSIENKGTVMVLNFWYTTCVPCVAEIPEFETVRKEFADDIIMVAIHSPDISENIQRFLDNTVDNSGTRWSDYGIIFAQDTKELDCYTMLGGVANAYPITAVIGKDGKIAYQNVGEVSSDTLRSQIQSLLNA
jgi:ferredoxin/thiol-disulfide isomerase/thioredoxin